MSTTPSPFVDHAADILRGEPAITDDQRADLHDIFYQSKDENDLANKISPLAIPDDLKQQLFDKKKSTAPTVDPIDKVTAAMEKMKSLDPDTLELAEHHPAVLKVLTSAALMPDKDAAPTSAAPAPKPSASGKKTKTPALALPPRPDGLDHLPPIPDGHYRVRASDSGLHDVPAENIQKVFDIDPRAQILNP